MPGVAVQRILQRLQGVKPISNGWVARCPGHHDEHQSLQISERNDQSVGLHCHAGCGKEALLSAMGITFADLFADESTKPAKREIVSVYSYKALDGTLLYQSIRYQPKDFRQRRPNGVGGWIWDMAPFKGKTVAYRLPELSGHNVVVVVEGEKDADALWALGIPATTNVGGAKKWGAAETKSLVQAGVTRVVIIPDNDEAGEQHAVIVAKAAKAHGLSYTVERLPGDLPAHGDVSDWLSAGGTKEALDAIFAKPYLVAPQTTPEVAAAQQHAPPPVDVLQVEQYHTTDLGAAESLRDRYGHVMRYDHQRNQWLLWDQHYWRPDVDDEATRVAYEHVRKLQRDTLILTDVIQRKRYMDWALAREKRSPLVSMLAQAQALKPMALSGDAWDSDGWVLGCPNGIVDLRTGVLRPGNHEDLVTLQAGTTFSSDATCPRWERFLDEIFDGDVELIDYVWRAVGYSLTADMREQCFFVLHGSGSNGKSIFVDALEHVFGTYGHRADMRMFAGLSADSNSFENADFRGKRLIFAAEVKPGARMNEHILKHFTGGESLRAEHKYGRSFTIRPVGKIWLGVNHRPKVQDDSFGFWRRVRMIPFLRTFTGTAADLSLRDTLRAEVSGILRWAVEGCLKWQAEGLTAPEVVRMATEEYQVGEDPLAEFLDQRVEVAADAVVAFADLYAAYRSWAAGNGLSPREQLTSKAFSQAMSTRPFDRVKVGSMTGYRGLAIIDTGGQQTRFEDGRWE